VHSKVLDIRQKGTQPILTIQMRGQVAFRLVAFVLIAGLLICEIGNARAYATTTSSNQNSSQTTQSDSTLGGYIEKVITKHLENGRVISFVFVVYNGNKDINHIEIDSSSPILASHIMKGWSCSTGNRDTNTLVCDSANSYIHEHNGKKLIVIWTLTDSESSFNLRFITHIEGLRIGIGAINATKIAGNKALVQSLIEVDNMNIIPVYLRSIQYTVSLDNFTMFSGFVKVNQVVPPTAPMTLPKELYLNDSVVSQRGNISGIAWDNMVNGHGIFEVKGNYSYNLNSSGSQNVIVWKNFTSTLLQYPGPGSFERDIYANYVSNEDGFNYPYKVVNGTARPLENDTAQRQVVKYGDLYESQSGFSPGVEIDNCSLFFDAPKTIPLGDQSNPAIVKIGGKDPIVVHVCVYSLDFQPDLLFIRPDSYPTYNDSDLQGLNITLSTRVLDLPAFEPIRDNVSDSSVVVDRVSVYVTADNDATMGLHVINIQLNGPIDPARGSLFSGQGLLIYVDIQK